MTKLIKANNDNNERIMWLSVTNIFCFPNTWYCVTGRSTPHVLCGPLCSPAPIKAGVFDAVSNTFRFKYICVQSLQKSVNSIWHASGWIESECFYVSSCPMLLYIFMIDAQGSIGSEEKNWTNSPIFFSISLF